jgi:hypothetical protein
MEAFQSYYLYKQQQQELIKKMHEKYIHEYSILWAKESMRLLLTYEDIQHKIILYYFPEFTENIKYMRTFQDTDSVIDYCEEVIDNINISGKVVIIVSNRQIIIIEKTMQEVYIVDPTSMLHIKSIFEIDYLETTLIPMFKKNHYECEYVQLSYPIQTDFIDMYSHTWIMILLVKCLAQLYTTNTIYMIMIPDKSINKQKLLSNFHINILNNVQINRELKQTFLEMILYNINVFETYRDLEWVLNIDPVAKIIEHHL